MGGVPPLVDSWPLDSLLGLLCAVLSELLSELLLELLSDLLCDSLLELLDDGLDGGELELGGGGLEELGGVGSCGVVGLLALGQPLNNMQAQVMPAARPSWRPLTGRLGLLGNFIGIGNILGAHGHLILESRAKRCDAQLAHQAIGFALKLLVLVQPFKLSDPALFSNSKF